MLLLGIDIRGLCSAPAAVDTAKDREMRDRDTGDG